MLLFDYGKAMQQVRELRQIANEMQNVQRQKLAEAITGVQNSWKGQSGQQFLRKCNDLSTRIQNEVRHINTVADSLERTANTIEEQERALARLLTGGLSGR